MTSGDEGFSMGLGEVLVLMCSVVFSGHILVIDHFSPKVDGVQLSFVQFFTAGCISTVAALLLEGSTFTWGGLFAAWGPLLYVGILSSGVAYTLQIVGQAGLNPAVILSQPLSTRELIGCGLVFAGVVLAQLPGRARAGKA